jgi:hypothetical protein
MFKHTQICGQCLGTGVNFDVDRIGFLDTAHGELSGQNSRWPMAMMTGFLVGGEHGFYDFPYIGNVIIPTDELIFFRGVETTNQLYIGRTSRN